MTNYDSNLLQQDANALSSLASEQLAKYAAAAAVVAWVAVFFLEPIVRNLLHLPQSYSLIPLQIVAALIAAILGGVWGYEKGLALKVQAEMALCQRQIEQNTCHLEAIQLNTSHLAGIAENTNRLEKIEEKIDHYVSHSEERVAALL